MVFLLVIHETGIIQSIKITVKVFHTLLTQVEYKRNITLLPVIYAVNLRIFSKKSNKKKPTSQKTCKADSSILSR